MSNVFVYCFNNSYLFACLVAWLYEDECIWWISLLNFSSMFCLFLLFSLFLYFVISLSPLYLYISYKVMFSIFLSSSIFIILVCFFSYLWFFLFLSLQFSSVIFLSAIFFPFLFFSLSFSFSPFYPHRFGLDWSFLTFFLFYFISPLGGWNA